MYKLQKYEDEMCGLIKEYYANIPVSVDELINTYNQYVNPQNIEKSYLSSLYTVIFIKTDFELYDKMRNEFPDYTDMNLIALTKKAFFKVFKKNVTDFII